MKWTWTPPAVVTVTAFFPWISLGLLAGCDTAPVADAESNPEPPATQADFGQLPALPLGSRSRLAVVGPEGEVRVGDSLDVALRAFPRPPRAVSVRGNPPFLAEPFEARGWETSAASLGIVARDERVWLVVWTQENLSASEVASEIDRYRRRRSPDEQLGSGPLRFWFWQDPAPWDGAVRSAGQPLETRRMLGVVETQPGRYRLVVGLGATPLMDQYRMSPAAVSADRDKALERLRRRARS